MRAAKAARLDRVGCAAHPCAAGGLGELLAGQIEAFDGKQEAVRDALTYTAGDLFADPSRPAPSQPPGMQAQRLREHESDDERCGEQDDRRGYRTEVGNVDRADGCLVDEEQRREP